MLFLILREAHPASNAMLARQGQSRIESLISESFGGRRRVVRRGSEWILPWMDWSSDPDTNAIDFSGGQ
jgi:hypothetical protein